jgi:hypothetical protein
MRVTPEERACELVARLAPEWGSITKGDINLWRELLDAFCFEVDPRGDRTLTPGLPTLYIWRCAQSGDKVAYNLLAEAGAQLDFDRPKTPGGIARNAARDFTVDLLATVLMIEFPELFLSASNATAEGISAVDMVRKAIEDAGLECVDYRSPVGDEPVPRSMERAVRRFREKQRYRELLWSGAS